MQHDLITVTGGVGTDPDYKVVRGGRMRTRFRLASDVRKRNEAGEWETVSTSWYTVTCWGALAKHVSASVKKGHRVVVHGRFRIDEYTDAQGRPRLDPEITADVVGPDLTFNTATIEARPPRTEGAAPTADPLNGPRHDADDGMRSDDPWLSGGPLSTPLDADGRSAEPAHGSAPEQADEAAHESAPHAFAEAAPF